MRQTLCNCHGFAIGIQGLDQVPLSTQHVADSVVAHTQIVLPNRVARIALRQTLGNCHGFAIGIQGLHQVPLSAQHVADSVVAHTQVALPNRVARIALSQTLQRAPADFQQNKLWRQTGYPVQRLPTLEQQVAGAAPNVMVGKALRLREAGQEGHPLSLSRGMLRQHRGRSGQRRITKPESRQIPRRPSRVTQPDQMHHRLRDAQRILLRQSVEVIGDEPVQTAALPGIGQVAHQDALPQLGVNRVPLCLGAALDQVRTERPAHPGEGQLVPGLSRNLRHQHAQVTLPPARPGQGDDAEQRIRPSLPVVPSGAVEQLAVHAGRIGRQGFGFAHLQRLDPFGAGQVGELSFRSRVVVGLQQVHLLQGQLQPEGIAAGEPAIRQGLAQEHLQRANVGLAVESLPVEVLGDLAHLRGGHRRHGLHLGAGSVGQRHRFRPGNRRGQEPGVVGPEPGQPGQVPGPGGALELVESVDEHDDSGALRGPSQERGECPLDFLRAGLREGGLQPALGDAGPSRLIPALLGRQRILDLEEAGQLVDPPAQEKVDAPRALVDSGGVGENEDVVPRGLLLLQGAVDPAEDAALARAGFPRDANAPRAPLRHGGERVLDQGIGHRLALDETTEAALDEVVQAAAVGLQPGPGGIAQPLPGLPIQVLPEIGLHLSGEILEIHHLALRGIPPGTVGPDAIGELVRDPLLQRLELAHPLRRFRIFCKTVVEALADGGGHAGVVQLTEVEPAAPALVGVLEHAVEDLQLGDALSDDAGFESSGLRGGLHAFARGRPPVAVAQDADEEGPRAFDLIQAYLQHLQLALPLVPLLRGLDALAQVDRLQVVAALQQLLAQDVEGVDTQVVPLGVHVGKGAADEERPGFPGGEGGFGHGGVRGEDQPRSDESHQFAAAEVRLIASCPGLGGRAARSIAQSRSTCHHLTDWRQKRHGAG